ncbi:MAG: hypothetical protein J6R47_03685, partial [Acholeplasmatales bacterium]|nr:hypothetical protein [Acholeplasmatales bacterium]
MKKIIKKIIIIVFAALIGSVLLQFGYNMLFVKEAVFETTKGGDGKLNTMLYESDKLNDSYFEDEALISSNLEGALERIDIREDCADFTANALIRFYLENKHRLKSSNINEIKNTLINFKYWMDQYDGRKDSMCHWSENHQILFAVTEYLVGMEWKDEIFADGNTGIKHVEFAKERINAWMMQRFYYGFNEYYSNNYYPEDIAPMANFIQFASKDDSDMIARMKIVMDIIFYDIASQSHKYIDINGNTQYAFMSASGRMYMDNKASDDTGNRLRPYIDLVLDNGEDYKTNSRNFFVCFKRMYEYKENGEHIYQVPEVIKEIFNDPSAKQIVKSSNGITIQELVADGFVGQNVNQIMMQTGMEAFSNPEVIDNSIKYLNKNKLFNNEFLNDFKLVNLWPLTLTKSLKTLSKLLNPSTNGKAIQRANVYTYQTPYYSMSTSQAHFAGDYADQHQINLSNISNDISVYNSQPMRISSRGQYFVGYGRLPYSVQDENINVSIYTVPSKKGMLEPHIVEYTHAYFPVGLFDEVNLDYLDEGYIFGRKNNTYVSMAVKSNEPAKLMFKNDMENVTKDELEKDFNAIKESVRELIETTNDHRYDLIYEGGNSHAWVTELSSVEEDNSFESFVNRILNNQYTFENN